MTSRFVRNRRTYLLIQSLSIDAGGGVPHPHLLSAARSLEGEAGVLLALLRGEAWCGGRRLVSNCLRRAAIYMGMLVRTLLLATVYGHGRKRTEVINGVGRVVRGYLVEFPHPMYFFPSSG